MQHRIYVCTYVQGACTPVVMTPCNIGDGLSVVFEVVPDARQRVERPDHDGAVL